MNDDNDGNRALTRKLLTETVRKLKPRREPKDRWIPLSNIEKFTDTNFYKAVQTAFAALPDEEARVKVIRLNEHGSLEVRQSFIVGLVTEGKLSLENPQSDELNPNSMMHKLFTNTGLADLTRTR